MTKNNIGTLSKAEIDEIFDNEWYTNLQIVTDFVMDNSYKLGLTEAEAMKYIVDYNIERRLKEKVLDTLIKRMPKTIYWDDDNLLDIFDDFKDIIDNCNVCENFKSFTIKACHTGSEKIINMLNFLKALVNRDYENLHVEIIPLKAKNKLNIKITRLNK